MAEEQIHSSLGADFQPRRYRKAAARLQARSRAEKRMAAARMPQYSARSDIHFPAEVTHTSL